MARRASQDVNWAALFREWRDSGLTQPEFCRQGGIPLHTFRRRLYRRDAEPVADLDRPAAAIRPAARPTAKAPGEFLPVRVVEDDRASTGSASHRTPVRSVEIILACGYRIAVPPGFDVETLIRVISILEPPRC
ncbi:hypothetical protein EP7_002021 [Isosphaeraceae bacterium EP7]